jgi:2-keto-4-pentenoate hydratase/2-oxohepta-3-ene-1,7-dioic acid hydratase in catechol pathway
MTMRYVRFQADSQMRWGIMDDEAIWAIDGNFFDRYGLTGERYSPADVKFLAPCIPSKVVAVGLNYQDHIEEFNRAHIPAQPVLFVKLHHTVIGPDDAIVIPPKATRVDYEAELAVVMKKTCYRVDPDSAAGCILGATCLNDVTERDMQRADGQWFRAKNFETFCPIGPHIVDGIDYDKLDIKLLLNGEVRQQSNTAHLIWSVPRLVSFISQVAPLYPGDIVTTGTPSGVGPIQEGDVVEVVIEGIGTLRNTVRKS